MSAHHATEPRLFSAAWFGYWCDMLLLAPLVVAIAAYDARSIMWAGAFAAGFLLWTFIEYWTHRSLLHVFFWHGIHERHHLAPAEWIVFTWWHTPLLFSVLFAAAWFVGALALYAGFAAGYVWFLLMHHWLHHVDLASWTWLQRYAIWHNRHHKLSDCNYGITTPMWDVLFQTSR